MDKKLIFVAVGVVVVGGFLYYTRTAKQAPTQQKETLVTAKGPVIDTVCVENIQNLSHQPVNMDGIDDELVAQLQKVGFNAHKIANPDGKPCGATINAELVEISGRTRKTARVDFRLTLAGEEPPRISASAQGKSGAKSAPKLASNLRPMTLMASQPDKTGAEREAIIAALEQQASQIDTAYRRGLQPWLPAPQ
jgi:hypothetical protein